MALIMKQNVHSGEYQRLWFKWCCVNNRLFRAVFPFLLSWAMGIQAGSKMTS